MRISSVLDRHRNAVIAGGLVISIVGGVFVVPAIMNRNRRAAADARATLGSAVSAHDTQVPVPHIDMPRDHEGGLRPAGLLRQAGEQMHDRAPSGPTDAPHRRQPRAGAHACVRQGRPNAQSHPGGRDRAQLSVARWRGRGAAAAAVGPSPAVPRPAGVLVRPGAEAVRPRHRRARAPLARRRKLAQRRVPAGRSSCSRRHADEPRRTHGRGDAHDRPPAGQRAQGRDPRTVPDRARAATTRSPACRR